MQKHTKEIQRKHNNKCRSKTRINTQDTQYNKSYNRIEKRLDYWMVIRKGPGCLHIILF